MVQPLFMSEGSPEEEKDWDLKELVKFAVTGQGCQS